MNLLQHQQLSQLGGNGSRLDQLQQHQGLRADQIECLCRALEGMECADRMALFIQKFDAILVYPGHENNSCREAIVRTKALSLFHEARFDEFFAFVSGEEGFAAEDHGTLQKLWNEAHYAQIEQNRGGQKLDPVARYRIRHRNNFPRTIWDGEEIKYCFKRSSRDVLKEFFKKEQTPNQQQKLELCAATGLTLTQISNWFKNQRQRAKQRIEGRSSSSRY